MKLLIMAEIERIAGDRLTPAMREEIASCAIKVIEDHNRVAALAALETVKTTMVASAEAAVKESK